MNRAYFLLAVIAALGISSVSRAQGGSVVEPRGEATYRIPIVVPPGPGGHQPDVALVYNSGEGKGPAGWLGFGWAVAGESRIERETRTGSPYDFDNRTCGTPAKFPCYRSAYVLDGQDLICSSGTCSTCTTGAPCRYRTQSDDGRIINFKGETSGWEIKDRDGRVLIYGAAAAGRLQNPATIIGRVFSWQLESSTDVNGNVISYTYDTTSSPNSAYLKKILYGQGSTGNRSVEFILNNPTTAPRPDKPVSARAGFRQQTDRRVASIEVKASNTLVTRYDLTYSQDPDSTRSQLATVQRIGSDAVSALPPYTFEYSFRPATRGLFGTAESSFLSAATSCAPGGGYYGWSSGAGIVAAIADMNRDGLGDLYQVKNFSTSSAGAAAAALGTGARYAPGPGQNCSSISAFGLGTPWSAYKLLFSETYGGSAVMDFDGDGYLDHLFDNGYPYDPTPYFLRRGSASGFLEPPLNTSFELPHAWSFELNSVYVLDFPYIRIAETDVNSTVAVIAAMADVTGDGRPDLVTTRFKGPYDYYCSGCDTTWPSWTGWAVFVNRGLKSGTGGTYLDFGSEPIRWPATLNAPIQNDVSGIFPDFLLADQNGDGLADRIFQAAVEYGYGAGFYVQEPLTGQTGGNSLAVNAECAKVGVYDLNGDGLLDHVYAQGTGTSNPNWTVHFGTGHGFSTVAKVFPSDGGGNNSQCLQSDGQNALSASLVDVNGDGALDRLRDGGGVRLNAGALDPNAATDPNLPSAVLPGLLLRATDPLGGVVEFTYQTAPQIKDASGLPANPGFSLPKPVVTRVRYRDGRSGTPPVVSKFWYGNGAFDYAEKEFRGFGTVVSTQVENGVDTSTTTSTYLTDRICALSPASSQTSAGATILARESMSYQTVTGGGTVPAQWTKCLPLAAVVESVEGSEATKKVRRTSWDFGTPINANYNLAKLQEWGEWNLSTNQNVAGDERITEYTYASPASGWPSIVSRVSLETVKDNAGNVYSKRKYCYTAACADANKGLLISVRDFLTDYTANPLVIDVEKTVSTIAYDAFGNPTQSTGAVTTDDANGLRTTIAYDSTYQTFPVSVSRGSDVALPLRPLTTTLAYTGCAGGFAPPPALGLPCSVTAPQGQADVLGYDAFGRVKRVERPTSAYVETRTYTLPGSSSPGQNILETRVIRSGFSDLVERQFMDGLSRIYKQESPGKQTQTVIVDRSFDYRGRLRTESLPYFTGGGQLRTYSYDALGRPTVTLDPDAVTQRVLSYTPWTVVDETYFGAATPGNRKQRTERSADGLGRLVRVAQFEDAAAATTPYLVTAKYDAADRLYEVRDPIANNGSLCTSLNMGAQCATQDHVTEIQWDTFGRRVKIDDPDSGIWTYKYDDAGLVKERTQNGGTASARTQLFTYDQLERPMAKTFTPTGNGVANATFVYENNNANPDFAQLIQITATGGTTYIYGYDAAGRRDAVIQRTAGKEFGQVFVYDELDRVKSRLFPDGETFNYTYDGLRLTAISADPANPAFKGKVLKSADYDALGRMKTIAVGETTGGATLVTNTYTYDATHARLTRVQGVVPSSTPLDLTVAFDGLGRLTSQTGTLGAEAVSRSYTYDGLSRLKTAVGPWEKATGATGAVTWTYSYDALGNLRGQTSTRTPSNLADVRTWSYGHAAKPHFLSSFAQANQPTETLAATLGGEVGTITRPSLPTETLVWNALGKLRQHKSSTYSYDAFGELTQTVTGPSGSTNSIVSVGDDFEYDITALRSNKFFSIQGVRIASLATSYTAPNASVPPVLRFVLHYAEPLAAPTAAALLALGLLSLASLTLRRRTPVWLSVPGVSVLSFTLVALPYTAHAATLTSGPGAYGRHGEPILAYIVDHLGTIRGAVNQAGVVVETRDYAPFGESISKTGTFAVQHRFTGQPQDDQAGGLYNYGARFYNPKWGRFVSPDEVVQGFDSQGLNPFAYVLNGPTSMVDPTGRLFDLPIFSLGGLSGVAGVSAAPSGSESAAAAAGGGPSRLICNDWGCVLAPLEASADLGGGDSIPVVLPTRWIALEGLRDFAPAIARGLWAIPAFILFYPTDANAPTLDQAKANSDDQDTVIQWAKDGKRRGGISKEEADALRELAKEAGVEPVEDHTDPGSAAHWGGRPHIRIGPVNHIPVK